MHWNFNYYMVEGKFKVNELPKMGPIESPNDFIVKSQINNNC